jgi:hypothetical protein
MRGGNTYPKARNFGIYCKGNVSFSSRYKIEASLHMQGIEEESGPDQVCGGRVWDVHSDNEQLEAVNSAKCSSCELGFERVNIILEFMDWL